MRLMRFLLVVIVMTTLASCGSTDRWLNAGYSAPPLAMSGDQFGDLAVRIKAKVDGATDCFADSLTSRAGCAGIRNRVMSVLMAESVGLCTEHLNSIYGREASFNIATGSLAALASGFAAVSTGGQASSLSALSAFASAERALVNETIYKSMLTTAIGTKISQIREEKGKALLLRKRDAFDSYGMEDAIFEVLAFHESCSFRVGLQVALAEGTQTTPAVKRAQLEARAIQLRNQIETYTRDQSGPRADRTMNADGKPNTADPILRGWLEEYTVVSRAIVTSLSDSGTAPTPAPAASTPR